MSRETEVHCTGHVDYAKSKDDKPFCPHGVHLSMRCIPCENDRKKTEIALEQAKKVTW